MRSCHKTSCLLALGVSLSLPAWAQNSPIRDPNDQLMREQQEKLRQELLQQNATGKIQQDGVPAAGAADEQDGASGDFVEVLFQLLYGKKRCAGEVALVEVGDR